MSGFKTVFRNLSIRGKLMVIVLVTVGISLLIADGALLATEWRSFKGQLVEGLKSQAKIVGANSIAALLFDDQKAAKDVLSALSAIDNVRFAMLHDQNGQPFAIYQRDNSQPPSHTVIPKGVDYTFGSNRLDLYMPVMMTGQQIGTVHISSSLATLYSQLSQSVAWSLLTTLAAFSVGILVYTRLHRLVTAPIDDLAATITLVGERKNYSLRARRWAIDEVGRLVDGFNDMLSSIQSRDTELEIHRAHLEEEVTQRTAELATTKNFLEGIIQTSTGMIYVVGGDECCTFVNDHALELLGYTSDELFRQPFPALFAPESKNEVIGDLQAIFRGRTVFGRENKLVRKDAKNLWFEYSMAPLVENGKVVSAVVTGSDVTKRKHMEKEKEALVQELNELATRDGLTGLYNHRTFYTMLEDEIVRSRRFDRPLSILMIDIDHFKQVNDSYGHQAGDIILRDLSSLLQRQARTIDRVCRYGGEEIVVILLETDSASAPTIAERLRASVERESFAIGSSRELHITVSIGVATFPTQADSTESLVSIADQALYAAKEGGRNRVDSAMNIAV